MAQCDTAKPKVTIAMSLHESEWQETDKAFWHDYIPFYEQHLPEKICGLIVEFGVFRGASLRWLLAKFPDAQIVGVDIEQPGPDWPKDPRIRYVTLDQGNQNAVQAFFAGTPYPDLIIEDGSHIPLHQSLCLKYGLKALTHGGVYVLEDIHTSHPAHQLYKDEFSARMATFGLFGRLGAQLLRRQTSYHQTSLSTLLAMEHLKRLNKQYLTPQEVGILSDGTHFNAEEIRRIFDSIGEIYTYRRSRLPLHCYKCQGTTFDYHKLKCMCGTDLLAEADSMSIIIKKQ